MLLECFNGTPGASGSTAATKVIFSENPLEPITLTDFSLNEYRPSLTIP
jgi:hypothetical protein